MKKLNLSPIAILSLVTLLFASCGSSSKVRIDEEPLVIRTNPQGQGPEIELSFWKGKAHNHPLMAVWIEDLDGNYIQTLYVARSIATGVFGHGDKTEGFWQPGAVRRPAALPYWSHKRGIPASDGLYTPDSTSAVPDAYTGATPQSNFMLESKADTDVPASYRVLFEINQTWDWNEFWTNNKYPDDINYKTSCQPSLIYAATIHEETENIELKLIGRGHHSGADGKLYTDLETMTTALEITDSVLVRVK